MRENPRDIRTPLAALAELRQIVDRLVPLNEQVMQIISETGMRTAEDRRTFEQSNALNADNAPRLARFVMAVVPVIERIISADEESRRHTAWRLPRVELRKALDDLLAVSREAGSPGGPWVPDPKTESPK